MVMTTDMEKIRILEEESFFLYTYCMKFADLHSHIAWELDDGMPSREDAIVSLETARKDGILAICSTPHIVPGQCDAEFIEEIIQRQNELAYYAEQEGIQIYRGSEMFMNFDFLNALEEGLYISINHSAYLLCEFDVRKDITYVDLSQDYFYEIKVRHMIPLLAHVERYFHRGLDFNLLEKWKEEGVIFQVNRTSLLGMNGKTIQKNAWQLIEEGYASLVCTDTHRSQGSRIEVLSDIYEELVSRVGQENAERLLWENPVRILNNMQVLPLKKVNKKRNRFKI